MFKNNVKILLVGKFHKYKNIIIFTLGIFVAIIFSQVDSAKELMLNLGNWGYLGAIIGGMLFVFTFSAATGALILLAVLKTFPPVTVVLVASVGALIGDYIIFRFVKNDLMEEAKPIYNYFEGSHLYKILHTRYFKWTLPVLGAIIIALPLPNELGVSLLGISEMKTKSFLAVSFVLNLIAIIILSSAFFAIEAVA